METAPGAGRRSETRNIPGRIWSLVIDRLLIFIDDQDHRRRVRSRPSARTCRNGAAGGSRNTQGLWHRTAVEKTSSLFVLSCFFAWREMTSVP